MPLIDQLNSASFRGIPFLLDSNEQEGGRKTVTHEYPNKLTRYVEDLGGMLRKIKVKGTISEPNYKSKRDALITALETPGIGILVHPFHGIINVVPKPYRLHESMQRVGEANFDMEFEEATPPVYPEQSSDNTSVINQFTDGVYGSVQSSFADQWEVFNKYKANFENAQGILGGLANKFSGVVNPFDTVLEKKSQFEQAIADFKSNVNNYIQSPPDLATSIAGLFNKMDEMPEDARGRFDLSQNFFNYGADVQLPPPTTFKRQQLIVNNKSLYSMVNFLSLANSFNAAAQIKYTDENDLNYIEDQLDAQFYYAIDNCELDSESLATLKELRNQSRLRFDALRLDVRRLYPITTKRTTITLLTYAYYNSLDNDALLIDLNDITTPNNIEGALNIVTAQ